MCEARGVVEGLASSVGQRGALLGDARVVQHLLGVEHGLLGGLEHGIHAPQHAHRQDDVGVLAAPEQVAQHFVSDAPDERDDLVVCCLVHCLRALVCCVNSAGFVVGAGVDNLPAATLRSYREQLLGRGLVPVGTFEETD